MKQAKDRVYMTESRKELVPEGDERAAFLYAAAGQIMHDSEADRFGNFADFFEDVESVEVGTRGSYMLSQPKPPAPAHRRKNQDKQE
jgi:hypothetical protein